MATTIKVIASGLLDKNRVIIKGLAYWFELNGERLNVTQWCKKYGLNLNTVRERIKRGWTPTEAVSKSLIGANIDG
jgi:hypothetical protein